MAGAGRDQGVGLGSGAPFVAAILSGISGRGSFAEVKEKWNFRRGLHALCQRLHMPPEFWVVRSNPAKRTKRNMQISIYVYVGTFEYKIVSIASKLCKTVLILM
jgi:hypothetical protein